MSSDMESRMQDQIEGSQLTFVQMVEEMDQLRKDLAEHKVDAALVSTLHDEMLRLKHDLAERETECLYLRAVLKLYAADQPDVAALDKYVIPQPPSTSYLERWVKENFGDPDSYKCYKNGVFQTWACNPQRPDGGWTNTPLYARKV